MSTEIKVEIGFNNESCRYEIFFMYPTLDKKGNTKKTKRCVICSSNLSSDRIKNQFNKTNAKDKVAKAVNNQYEYEVVFTPEIDIIEHSVQSKGGLQPRQKSADGAALTLDKDLRKIIPVVWEEFQKQYQNETRDHSHIKRVSKEMLMKNSIFKWRKGCEPDGGVIVKNMENGLQEVVVQFEAKKQGTAGNAQDRAYKNFGILNKVWSKCNHCYFFTGDGANIEKVASSPLVQTGQELLNCGNDAKTNLNEINDRVSVFCKVESFTYNEIYDIIWKVLSHKFL